MSRLETLKNLIVLEKLIRERRTGTPEELANRLSISRSSLYELISDIKSHDINIKYCRTDRTFHYDCNKVIEILFKVKVVTDTDELRNISGGYTLFFSKIQVC